jgi:ribose/xylose/arabinose/galactoside ABC-type transport system permease subunit
MRRLIAQLSLQGIGGGLVAPLCLVVSITVFSFLSAEELQVSNLKGLLGQMAPLAIIALGQLIVIITRGFDISVGSVAALAAVISVMCVNALGPIGFAMAPIVGLGCGLVNGVLIGRFRVQPVIATLGMLSVARGLVLAISGNQAVALEGDNPLSQLGYGSLAGIPISFLVTAALAIAVTVMLSRTRAGRRIHMLGSNPQGAELVGVSPARTLLFAYALTGLLAGIAALVLVGRAGAGLPTEGQGLELSTIAAAVIGGANLAGGVGKPVFVLIGALFIQSLNNGLTLAGISSFTQEIILGAVILGAGLADRAVRWITTSQRSRRGTDGAFPMDGGSCGGRPGPRRRWLRWQRHEQRRR